VAKSSSKRPSRVKPSAAKKSASKLSSKAKQSPVKSKRPVVKAASKKAVAAKSPAKKPAAAKPVAKPAAKKPALKAKPVAKAPVPKKIAAKPAVAAKPAIKTKPIAASKLVRPLPPVQPKSEPFKAGPSVATNQKPHKSQIGLSVKELEHFWDLLLAKRRELVGDMSSMEREALRSGSATNLSTLPMHMADMGTDNFEQEFTLGLVEKDRNLLREINNALSKIQNGTYGICEGTGMPISKARLEAAPWSRFSIEYARQKEKNGMGVRTI
jgi:RNA polymerase-binding protein DksA